MQMTVAELFDRLLEGLESGRLQGDEPVPPGVAGRQARGSGGVPGEKIRDRE